MSRYIGICYDSGAWGGDLTGVLLVETDSGWEQEAGHISSDAKWSESDIGRHYERREAPADGDTYEWVGLLPVAEIAERYPSGAPRP